MRERNFILCYRGADTYGFVHRTFLEYFCALEIVNRFEKVRSISFEELRDQTFGRHWQNESWHEVLRLICRMINVQFSGQLIEFLIDQKIDRAQFLDNDWLVLLQQQRFSKEGLTNILLAISCFVEIGCPSTIAPTKKKLLQALKQTLQSSDDLQPGWEAAEIICGAIAMYYREEVETLPWLIDCLRCDDDAIRQAAVSAIAAYYRGEAETLPWLIDCARCDDSPVRWAAVRAIAEHYRNESEIFPLLCERIQYDSSGDVRDIAVRSIAQYFTQEPKTFELLCQIVTQDPYQRKDDFPDNPRKAALEFLLTHYSIHPKTIELLHDRAIKDPDEQLREWAQQQLEQWESKG